MNTNKITLSQLENFLMGAADILRGKMDASEYKEYISNWKNLRQTLTDKPTMSASKNQRKNLRLDEKNTLKNLTRDNIKIESNEKYHASIQTQRQN